MNSHDLLLPLEVILPFPCFLFFLFNKKINSTFYYLVVHAQRSLGILFFVAHTQK